MVKLLVSQGSDKSCKDKRGYTPLHAAAASGHVDVVKYLLRNGAEVSVSLMLSFFTFLLFLDLFFCPKIKCLVPKSF